jgi:hypothetical protein
MKLRPRYSLLTLLVLTALVAGGVKLWHGPHSFALSVPPTAKEQVLLGAYAEHELLQQQSAAETEGQYLNTFAGPELLLIQGRPGPNVRWLVKFAVWGSARLGDHRRLNSGLYLLPVKLEYLKESSSGETIRFWCSSPQLQPPVPDPVSVPESDSLKPIIYTVLPPRIPGGYFVSDRKRVYQSKSGSKYMFLSPIQVTEIPDPKLRVLIEQELASIPDPQ